MRSTPTYEVHAVNMPTCRAGDREDADHPDLRTTPTPMALFSSGWRSRSRGYAIGVSEAEPICDRNRLQPESARPSSARFEDLLPPTCWLTSTSMPRLSSTSSAPICTLPYLHCEASPRSRFHPPGHEIERSPLAGIFQGPVQARYEVVVHRRTRSSGLGKLGVLPTTARGDPSRLSVHLIGPHPGTATHTQSVLIMTRNGWLVLCLRRQPLFLGYRQHDKLFATSTRLCRLFFGYAQPEECGRRTRSNVIPGPRWPRSLTRVPRTRRRAWRASHRAVWH